MANGPPINRLANWRHISDTVAPDVMAIAAVALVVLVGLGQMQSVALSGAGGCLSTACFLYRRRPPVGPSPSDGLREDQNA